MVSSSPIGPIAKLRTAAGLYRELLFEQPAPNRVKRFLFAVNGWCNSRCTFCNIWKYDKALALREEITLEELERNLFRSPALAGVVDVGITGGEPFLRRDLVAVYASLCRHFPQAHIGAVTNGLPVDRVVATMSEVVGLHAGRSFSVLISLDGYGDTHDQVRGVPGNFARVLKLVDQLKATVPAVDLGFSHTITPTNVDGSLRCYELARDLGVGFMYRLAHEAPYLRNEGQPIWTPDRLAAVRPVVAELNRRLMADQSLAARLANIHYARNAFYDDLMSYFDAPRRTTPCYSGTHSFLLGHDGEVYPCISLPHSMGNLRRQSFDEIWYSERAGQVRTPIAAWQCHCWTNCETELSLARRPATFVRGIARNLRTLPVLPGSGPGGRGSDAGLSPSTR
jgi:MoaA/NifB/PqqE/SkfB family radical SAM enzyme